MTKVLSDAAEHQVFESSGNVFADLDLPSAPEDMLKIEISRAIGSILRAKKLTQAAAATMVGTDPAKISALLKGRLKGFSVDRLLGYLLQLDQDIDIRLSKKSGDRPARVKVSRAA